MANEVRLMANEVQRPGCRPRRLWVCGPASLNHYTTAHQPRPDLPVEPSGKPETPPKPSEIVDLNRHENWHGGVLEKIRTLGKAANPELSRGTSTPRSARTATGKQAVHKKPGAGAMSLMLMPPQAQEGQE